MALVVGPIIGKDGQCSQNENNRGPHQAEGVGIADHIEGMRGINCWDPHKATPANIKASAIVHDIKRTKVTGFPIEKFRDVNQLQGNRNKEGIRKASKLVLLGGKGENNQWPPHHTKAAIGEHLNVPASDAWVEFGSPIIIKNEISGVARILGGGRKSSFEVENQAEDEAKYIECAEKSAKIVVNDSRGKKPQRVGA